MPKNFCDPEPRNITEVWTHLKNGVKVIPSKTPKEWELFYMENKKKFNFENHVKQYEKKHRH